MPAKRKNGLREWLGGSSFAGSPLLLAEYLGVPPRTVENWVYDGVIPRPESRLELYLLTKLKDFEPRNEGERLLLSKLEERMRRKIQEKICQLRKLILEIWETMEFFVLTPDSIPVLHKAVSSEELKDLAAMFERFAEPRAFTAWRLLRLLERSLREGSK